MKKTFTLEEIELAISRCTKHTFKYKTPPTVDGMLDSDLEVIELDMFLYKLFGCSMEEYLEYKKEYKTKLS